MGLVPVAGTHLIAHIYLLAEGDLTPMQGQSRCSYRQVHIRWTSSRCSWGREKQREAEKFQRQFH